MSQPNELATIPQGVPAVAPPSQDEWAQLTQMSKIIAASPFAMGYRGKPDDALVCLLQARELGLGAQPLFAIKHIQIINGRPGMSAELMTALIRRAGHSVSGSANDKEAIATGRRRDTGDEITVKWTIEMARRADLLGKDVWKKYPESMLWARAIAQLGRELFSDVLAGMSYTPEELEFLEPQEPRTVSNDIDDRAPGASTPTQGPTEPAAPINEGERKLTQEERNQLKRLFGTPLDEEDLRKGWSDGTVEGLRDAIALANAALGTDISTLAEMEVRHAEWIRAWKQEQQA